MTSPISLLHRITQRCRGITHLDGKSVSSSWSPPNYWHVMISLVIVSSLLSVALNILMTAHPQLSIRESCIDAGLPATCTDRQALNNAATFNIYAMAIPSLIWLVSVGVYGACQTRLGRRMLLTISISGQVLMSIPFTMIYLVESTRSMWKVLAICGAACQAFAGSYLIVILTLYGIVNDVSARHPEKRVYYYVGLDLMTGLCSIIGTQLAAKLLETSPLTLTMLCTLIFSALVLFVLIALPETVSPQLRSAKVDWKSANILKQCQFLLYNNKRTKQSLEEDAVMIYTKIKAVYELQNDLPFSQPFELGSHDEEVIDKQPRIQQSPDIQPLLNECTSSTFQGGYGDCIAMGETHETTVDVAARSHPLIPYPELLPTLKLPSAPQFMNSSGNGITVLIVCLQINMFQYLVHELCDLYYLKQEFSTGPQSFSNFLSLATIVKTAFSFLAFPLVNKFLTTPASSLFAVSIALVLQGLLYFVYPMMPDFTWFCVVNMLNVCVGVLPGAVLRSAASNLVSEKLQPAVMSVITSTQVITVLIGGSVSNALWALTSEFFSGTIYIVCGVSSIVAALVLHFCFNDTAEQYNLRTAMTTQFVLITDLEEKHAAKLQAEAEAETEAEAACDALIQSSEQTTLNHLVIN